MFVVLKYWYKQLIHSILSLCLEKIQYIYIYIQ